MPVDFINLYERLCKYAAVSEAIDPSIESLFAEPLSGKDLLNKLISHYSADEPLRRWLQDVNRRYFDPQPTQENPNPVELTYEEILPAFKKSLAGLLSLHVKKQHAIDIANMVPPSDFNCMEGTIGRMSFAVSSITGTTEKQFMMEFFQKEARQLVDRNFILPGNEVHAPVMLSYLFGFLTHTQALEIDPLYRSPLNIPPFEAIRIRDEFYKQFPKYVKDKINDELAVIIALMPKMGEDDQEYKSAVQQFEVRYHEEPHIFFKVDEEENYAINDQAVNDHVAEKYPQIMFTSYEELIEGNPESWAQLPILERLGGIRILRHTGDSNFGGNNLAVQHAMIEQLANESPAPLSGNPICDEKIEKTLKIQTADPSLTDLIIYGAPYNTIQDKARSQPAITITDDNKKQMAHAIAVRSNGAKIYNLIKEAISAPQRHVFSNPLLAYALDYENQPLWSAVMPHASLSDNIFGQLLNSSINSKYLKSAFFGDLISRMPEDPTRRREILDNYYNEQGLNALHAAAKNGHENAIKALIVAGADVKKADTNGQTALHLAAQNGRV